MNRAIITLFFLICAFNPRAQRDSLYEYIYQITPNDPNEKEKIKIDSSYNKIDTTFENQALTSIDGTVNDNSGKRIRYSTICLDSAGKTLWCNINERGKFDRQIAPGSYKLSVGEVGYKPIAQNFSIGKQTTIHFDIALAATPSLTVFDVHSKLKLSQKKIDQIRNCLTTKNLTSCEEKNVYFIMIEI